MRAKKTISTHPTESLKSFDIQLWGERFQVQLSLLAQLFEWFSININVKPCKCHWKQTKGTMS